MADYLIQQETAEVLANQIRRITGTEDQYNLAEIAEVLSRIEGNVLEPSGDLTICVVDYDGTVLKTANLSEGQAFALPDTPTHEGLRFTEWVSCVPIKSNMLVANQADILVCPMYETISGATEIHLSITDVSSSTFVGYAYGSELRVDWGDGNVENPSSGQKLNHTYSSVGEYIVKIYGMNHFRGETSYLLTRPYITGVHLSNELKTIGTYAFKNCINMKFITMTNNVKEIREYSFDDCSSLTQIVYPIKFTTDSNINIFNGGDYPNLKYICVPYGVEEFNYISLDFEQLETLTVPNTVTTISKCYDEMKDNLYEENGLYYISSPTNKKYAFAIADINVESADLSGATILCNEPFRYDNNKNVNLKNIVLPNVTKIPNSFIRHCTALSSVDIPDSVLELGDSSFSGCSSLSSIDLKNINKICDAALSNTGIVSLEIPETLTEIGFRAFGECKNLESIEFKSNPVVSEDAFGGYCSWFSNCASLSNIILHDSMTSIYDSMFYNCSSITNLDFLSNITDIYPSAFSGCNGLTSIYLSDKITNLYETDSNYHNPFGDCSNIESIVVDAHNSNYKSENNCVVCERQYYEYNNGNPLNEVRKFLLIGCKNSIIPDDTYIIKDGAFSGCIGLTSITLPNTVKYIDYSAFKNCTSLTEINLSSNLKEIDGSAFSGCTALESINLPDSLTYLGSSVFEYCSNLRSIIIPEGIADVSYYTFRDCKNLSNVTFNGTPNYISDSVFYNCTNLTTINVPWAEGEVAGAPWGATNATINYNYVG